MIIIMHTRDEIRAFTDAAIAGLPTSPAGYAVNLNTTDQTNGGPALILSADILTEPV